MKQNEKTDEKILNKKPWGLIITTIILILIPIIFKIAAIYIWNEGTNLPEEAYTDATGGAALAYFFLGFAIHSLAMWGIIINLIIISLIWIIYFIKNKRKNLKIKD